MKRFEKRVLARPTFPLFPQLCPELRVYRHLLEQPSLDRETARHINGPILWANLHLLFWLSLISFATGWMGKNHFAPWPVALYGAVLLFAGTAYFIFTKTLIARHGNDSTLATSIGGDVKGTMSLAAYAAAISLSLAQPWIGCALYVLVAIMWLAPDRRIEQALTE